MKISKLFNTLRPRQDGRHFTDDNFRCVFLNEYSTILTQISLKFIPKAPIKPAMLTCSLMHICVTQPQRVKIYKCLACNAIRAFSAVTAKITSLWTTADKTHITPVNLLYIIMFKIRKIKPNLSSVRQKPKSFCSDCFCLWRLLRVTWIQWWQQDFVRLFSCLISPKYLN